MRAHATLALRVAALLLLTALAIVGCGPTIASANNNEVSDGCCRTAAKAASAKTACFGVPTADQLLAFWGDVRNQCRGCAKDIVGPNTRKARILCRWLRKQGCVQ